MELIGDLQRAFAAVVYPNRWLVAIALALVVLPLAVVAVRRRWDLPLRRHPRRAAVILVPLLAVAGPAGWYLGSPLFLSTTLDEAPPASQSTGGTGTALVLSGSFTGADEFHFGSGTARLIETAPGAFLLRLEDFEVRNGPDLFVYISPSVDGYADGAVLVDRLKADRGNQNYAIPPGTRLDQVRSVVIWCRQFAVLFATAPLSAERSPG